MRVTIALKGTGWKYSGEVLFEDHKVLVIDDIKLGRLEIQKSEIALRGDF